MTRLSIRRRAFGACSTAATDWHDHGGRNLSYSNNTCLTAAGDIYSWGFYPSSEPLSVSVDPPFVHSNCQPAIINESAWATSSNTFMSANTSGVRVTCGETRWTLPEWQAMGHDKGSTQATMPSAAEVGRMGALLLSAAGHETGSGSATYM